MKSIISSGAALVIVVQICAQSQAGYLYGVSADTNSVYELNTATGAATLVTSISGDAFTLGGAEILNGQFYVSGEFAGGVTRFGTVDFNTGAFTALNNMDGDLNWASLAADPTTGRIYAVNNDGFNVPKELKYTNAPGDSVSTVADLTGDIPLNSGIAGLAHNDATGTLYGVGQGKQFYSIDKSTAVVSLIGTMTGLPVDTSNLAGLAFDQANQTMYLTTRDTSGGISVPSSLYTVNLANGAVSLVGSTGANTIEALAWSPTSLTSAAAVPEPSTFALLGMGGLSLCGYRRRQLTHGLHRRQ